jgi:hypothetical protein
VVGVVAATPGVICLPGVFDHLLGAGLALGAIYWGFGVILGRTMRELSPRAVAGITLLVSTCTVWPYLALLMTSGSLEPEAAIATGLLGGGGAAGGVLLGALSAYRGRQTRLFQRAGG